jgi:hypothetical protein
MGDRPKHYQKNIVYLISAGSHVTEERLSQACLALRVKEVSRIFHRLTVFKIKQSSPAVKEANVLKSTLFKLLHSQSSCQQVKAERMHAVAPFPSLSLSFRSVKGRILPC